MKRPRVRSRALRKLLRNKLAVVALAVITGYLAVSLLVLFGLISEAETLVRIGPGNVPGFFLQQENEKRLEDANFYLEVLQNALDEKDPQKAVAAIRVGDLRVAELPVSQLRTKLDQAWQLIDEAVQSANLNGDPAASAKLDELEEIVAEIYPYPTGWQGIKRTIALSLGTDQLGRSIALRGLYSTKVAIQIGLVTAAVSVLIGALMGTAAGFFGGWVDHTVSWLYTTFSSIPNLVLLVLLAHMFTGSKVDGTLIPVYIAFISTFWIGTCRVIRGETLKLKELEYVQAATAAGFGRARILLRHVLPNTTHLMLINCSLLFIGAIKSEVILTYLGLGVENSTSWGIMIVQSRAEVINGFFWQIGAATALMFGLVLAFNVVSDALQDAFDPRHT